MFQYQKPQIKFTQINNSLYHMQTSPNGFLSQPDCDGSAACNGEPELVGWECFGDGSQTGGVTERATFLIPNALCAELDVGTCLVRLDGNVIACGPDQIIAPVDCSEGCRVTYSCSAAPCTGQETVTITCPGFEASTCANISII